MCGVIIGTLCLIALIKLSRGCGYRRFGGGCGGGRWGGYGGGYGGGCGGGGRWGGWHGHHGHHGGGFEGEGGHGDGPWGFERYALRALFERLDTTPGQEKVIKEAFATLREAGKSHFATLREGREEIGRAFGAESFDETALGNTFAKHDEAVQAMRKAVADALLKVHAALDPQQRTALAEWMARGPNGWRPNRGGAPYRF